MDWYDDQPYSMIGVQTTLPVDPKQRIPQPRPIGFIWPKKSRNVKNKDLKTNGRAARKSKRR